MFALAHDAAHLPEAQREAFIAGVVNRAMDRFEAMAGGAPDAAAIASEVRRMGPEMLSRGLG
jgi:hypothetical protein